MIAFISLSVLNLMTGKITDEIESNVSYQMKSQILLKDQNDRKKASREGKADTLVIAASV